jgi:hypothetical protein
MDDGELRRRELLTTGAVVALVPSAQSIRFVGGPQQLSQKLARQLGRAVHLGIAITAIEQRAKVTLHAANVTYAARRAILTPPKPLLGRRCERLTAITGLGYGGRSAVLEHWALLERTRQTVVERGGLIDEQGHVV